jgi:hypothetical protein
MAELIALGMGTTWWIERGVLWVIAELSPKGVERG